MDKSYSTSHFDLPIPTADLAEIARLTDLTCISKINLITF